MPPKIALHDPILGPLTDNQITRDFWVYQRLKGHRYSSDDLATGFVAWQRAPNAKRILDLGCGLGAVLIHLAWNMPHAVLVGIEAQEMSFELLRRNVERNRIEGRVTMHHGDLRDPEAIAKLGTNFDLITGTPPYFPPGDALDAEDEQRAYARIEYRGGVEAYLATAAKLLGPGGTFVLCGAAGARGRVEPAAHANGLRLQGTCDVVAREGRPPLFCVWTLGREERGFAPEVLVLRDAEGRLTADAQRIRDFSGL